MSHLWIINSKNAFFFHKQINCHFPETFAIISHMTHIVRSFEVWQKCELINYLMSVYICVHIHGKIPGKFIIAARIGPHMRQKGGPNQQWLSWLCIYPLTPPESFVQRRNDSKRKDKERKFGSSGFERGTWWMSTSLGPHPENSVDRSGDRWMSTERKKEKMQICARAGDRTEIGWISTSRPSQWAVMGSHNLT